MTYADWVQRREQAEEVWRKAVPRSAIQTPEKLLAFARRLVAKAPAEMRVLLAWRLLGDSLAGGQTWGQTFLQYMHADLLSPEEKRELAYGCLMSVRAYEAKVMEEDGGTEALPQEWVHFPWMKRPAESARYAAVWVVELGQWTPAEGVEHCLARLERDLANVAMTTDAFRWGEAAADILLAWRGKFTEEELRGHLKTLCHNSQFRVRRVGFRAGVILFGQPFARPALKDPEKRLQSAAGLWMSQGAIDKPPAGLKGMHPYPRG